MSRKTALAALMIVCALTAMIPPAPQAYDGVMDSADGAAREAIREQEAAMDAIRERLADADVETRAEALVRETVRVEKARRARRTTGSDIKFGGFPDGMELIDVEFYRDVKEPGDHEIRVILDLPDDYLASDEFTEYQVSRIGHFVMDPVQLEDFNRFYIYARDPETGEAVDIQKLLPVEVVPEYVPEIDQATLEMAAEQGKPLGDESQSSERNAIIPNVPSGFPQGALSGKTVYINQGHGWFDDFTWSGNRWRVQRGLAFGINEDSSNGEFISLFVLPALRNAGAKVQTVRESDYQTNMVIVDNADPEYSEVGTWANSSLQGFKQKTTASWNGVNINPFGQGAGENRLSSGLTTGDPTATATWTATIPEDGYYHVYASWTAFSGRANDAQYLIHHSGGVSEVRMNQKIDGYTWNLLGNYYFEKNAPADQRKVVLTNNSSDGSAVNVSADAIRWGGGMGDMARHTNGVSGRPRWEEDAVNYLQFNGFGHSGDLYTGDDDEAGGWSDRPQYARWEHSGKDDSVEDAVYFAWHTNAANGSARGVSTFHHSTATQASIDFQYIMHDTVYDHIEGQFYPNWTRRSKNEGNYGENNQGSLGYGLPGFLLEGLFHDAAADATDYGDPKFRHGYARAIVDGVISYFEDRDNISLKRPPEPPREFQVESTGSAALLSWESPLSSIDNQYFGDIETGYIVHQSHNGFGFDDGFFTPEKAVSVGGLKLQEPTFFRITAVNEGGRSFPSETLVASNGRDNVLVVNGFDRNDRALVPQVSITNIGSPVLRVDPRTFQAFNYSVEHGKALAKVGVRVSSASNEAVIEGRISLSDYDAVFWICGEESTVDETFSTAEQNLVSAYMATPGRNLFVSGAEVGYDLGRSSSFLQDREFYNNVLRAAYVSDDAGTYNVASSGSGPFAGIGPLNFNPASGARYDADYPDRIDVSSGSNIALTYSGGAGGNAAVYYDGDVKVITLGFPFETISTEASRDEVMKATLDFFGLPTVPEASGVLVH